jgi:group I intron endonuclease
MGYLEQVNNISTDLAGIYLITNDINGKHYVGQSIYLRRRLLKHKSNWERNKYDTPLYRAFTKYGIDNFRIEVLWSTTSKEYNTIKKTLDTLEVEYIQKYKSYGEYNQTKGGDAGILGFKKTEKQIATDAYNSRFLEKRVYALNIIDMSTIMSINKVFLARTISGSRSRIAHLCNDIEPHIYLGKYIIGNSYEELQEKYKKYRESEVSVGYHNRGTFIYTDEEFVKLVQTCTVSNSQLSLPKIATMLGISKKTAYNYLNRLTKKGIVFNIKKR